MMIRYVELAQWFEGEDAGQPFVGTADYFVSHSWDSPWTAVVDAVCAHSASLPADAAKPFYWVDIFAINQHTPATTGLGTCQGVGHTCYGCNAIKVDLPAWETMQASHDVGFERVIRKTKKTLLVMEPWFRPRPPTRVWCGP